MSGKCPECEEGLPEWIMSYADMITILMAFFVVMYSMAGNKDTAKEQAVLQSLRNQFGTSMHGWGTLIPPIFRRHNASPIEMPFKGGSKQTDRNRGGTDQHHLREGEFARVHAPWPGEQSRVGGVIYFSDDNSELTEQQQEALKAIAAEVGGKPQKIEIRGHSARRAGRAASSSMERWDLAYERCRATMQYLTKLGVDPLRFRLGVAGENEPVSHGAVSSPYAQNSRVEVFMLNEVIDAHSRKALPKNKPTAAAKHESKEPA